jgi:hypothetical protein
MSIEKPSRQQSEHIKFSGSDSEFTIPEISSVKTQPWRDELARRIDPEFFHPGEIGIMGIYTARTILLPTRGQELPPLFASPDDWFAMPSMRATMPKVTLENRQEDPACELLSQSHTIVGLTHAATTFKKMAEPKKEGNERIYQIDTDERMNLMELLQTFPRIPTSLSLKTTPKELTVTVELETHTVNPTRGSDLITASLQFNTQNGQQRATAGGMFLQHATDPSQRFVYQTFPIPGFHFLKIFTHTIHTIKGNATSH